MHFPSVVGFGLVIATLAPRLSAHSATFALTGDPIGSPFFTGTYLPAGGPPGVIRTSGGVPGYLNGVSGGAFGGGTGEVLIGTVGAGETELVAFSIHLTDTAGPSHSLSDLNDPALAHVVADLNHPYVFGPILTAYAYNNAPAQYADALSILSAGEVANGGQPFDILVTATNVGNNGVWTTDFSGEIGFLDGITALTITDIGAVPEPSCGALFALVSLAALRRRRRSPQAETAKR